MNGLSFIEMSSIVFEEIERNSVKDIHYSKRLKVINLLITEAVEAHENSLLDLLYKYLEKLTRR